MKALRGSMIAIARKERRDVSTTIVLADDCPDLRAVYSPLLRSAGYDVLEASNGREAVDLVREHQPNLLILDLWMPFLNGFEVLETLRDEGASNKLKVLMLSNHSDAQYQLFAFKNGAIEFLVKNLTSLSELLASVERVLGGDSVSA